MAADNMVEALLRYANVTRDTAELFKSSCSVSKESEKVNGQGCHCYTDIIKGLAHKLRWILLSYRLVPKESMSIKIIK